MHASSKGHEERHEPHRWQAAAALEVAEQADSHFRLEMAGCDDVSRVLALLDAAVLWLNERGITEQWGSLPFSTQPRRVAQATEWMRSGAVLFAVTDDGDAGCLALGTAPSYVDPPTRSECYVNLLVSHRAPWARGAGARLLVSAKSIARRLVADQVRVDCYAGGDESLVRFYEGAGFARSGSFTVGTWPGQVLTADLRP